MDTKQKILKIIKDHKLEIVNTNNTNQAIWHGVNPKDLRRVFFELAKEGKFIEHGGTGRFFSVESLGYIKGKLSVHPKGFGFFTPDDITEELDKLMGGTGAFFVPANFLKGAMHEDTVLVSIQEDKFKKRGEDAPKEKKMAVVEVILSRGLKNIVGTYKKAKTGGYITPDNKSLTRDIFIEAKESMNAKDGEKVVVRLVGTTLDISSSKRLEGKVVERIGYPDLKGVDIISVARDYNLYQEFPKRVLEEASKIEDEVDDTKYGKRRKFYEHNIVTIDGEDSRDFDDAVHIEKEGDNFRVYVHIADVGEYVPVGSKLDLEAYNRGTSVYFPHYVLPMLPEKLSNGICSLNPNVKRLALTCEMLVNKNAEVLKHDIYESIIISKYRLTYNLVQSILENSKAGKAFETVPESVMKGSGVPAVVDAGVCEDIRNLNMLAKKLEIKRTKRGAIDFDIPEAYIKVDAKGRSTSVEKRPRFDSHRLIESWMVATNEVVAEHFFKIHMPFIYRIHEKPDEKKLDVFSQFVRTFGEKFEEEEAESSLGFQAFLNRIKGKDYEFIISRQALRSMQKAKYSEIEKGHYGLGATFYSHFTSPIRRYPDLTIHRIIKDSIHGRVSMEGKTVKMKGHPFFRTAEDLKSFVKDSSKHSSEREVLATEAEREVDDMKKAEYMEQFIGEEFDGVISSVGTFGMFVELDSTIEGLIHVTMLDEDIKFHEKAFSYVGPAKRYKLGDRIRVKVVGASKENRTIDFTLAE